MCAARQLRGGDGAARLHQLPGRQAGMKGLALRGKASVCRPLVVQFCAKSPEAFLEAALQVQERGGEHRREGPLSRASVQAPSSLLFEQERCDAVDLNLGCPQSKAMRGPPPRGSFWVSLGREPYALHCEGGWGGALMDEENWHIVYAIVRHAASSPSLRVPVTCKIRVFAAWLIGAFELCLKACYVGLAAGLCKMSHDRPSSLSPIVRTGR